MRRKDAAVKRRTGGTLATMAFDQYRTTGEGQEYYRTRLLRTIETVAPRVLRDLERNVLPAYDPRAVSARTFGCVRPPTLLEATFHAAFDLA